MIRALLRANTPAKETRELLALGLPAWLRPRRALALASVLLVVSFSMLLMLATVVAAEPAPNPCGDRGSGGNQCAQDNPHVQEMDRKKEEAERKRQEEEAKKTPEQKFEERVEKYKKANESNKGVLGAFQVTDRDGSPISIYQIHADTGDWKSWDLKTQHFLVEVTFQVNLWLVAFSCWLVSWALSFSLAALLLRPVIHVSNSLHNNLLLQLGLPSLFLTFAMVVAAWHWMFGIKARGWGEATAALVISALAATTLAAPATLLLDKDDGAVGKAQELSAYVGALIMDGVDDPGRKDEKEGQGGPPTPSNLADLPKEISRPITDNLVDAFIAKPAMLLSYGEAFNGVCQDDFRDARVRQAVYKDMLEEAREGQKSGLEKWVEGGLKKIPGIGDFLSDSQSKSMEQWRKDTGQDITQDDAWNKILAVGPIEAFEKKCIESKGGNVAAAKQASVEKIGGALFLLLASILTMAFIIASAGTYLNAQFWIAVEAALARFALVVGLLPGPGRAWLWGRAASIGKWLGMMVLAIAALALFIVLVISLINADETEIPGGLVVRFVIIDFAAVAMFMFRRKIGATASSLARRTEQRMGNSNFGGQSLTSPMDSAGGRSFAGRAATAALLAGGSRGGTSSRRWAGMRGAHLGGGGLVRSTLRTGAGTAGVVAQGVGIIGRGGVNAARTVSTPQGRQGLRHTLGQHVGRGMPAHVPADAAGLRQRIAAVRDVRQRPPGQRHTPSRPAGATRPPAAPPARQARRQAAQRQAPPVVVRTAPPRGGAHQRIRQQAARRAARRDPDPPVGPRRPRP